MNNLKKLLDFNPEEVDLSEYEKFKNRLKVLGGDISYNNAWRLAKWANGLIDYYNTQKVKAQTWLNNLKIDLEQLEAQKGIELGESVADGKRKAQVDEEVVNQKKFVNKAEGFVSYLEGLVKKLEKDHYLMKEKYKEGEREKGRS